MWQTYDLKSHFIYPYTTLFQNLNLKLLEIIYVLMQLQEALQRTFHNLISKLKLSNIKSLRQYMDLMQPQEATYMPPMKCFWQKFIHTQCWNDFGGKPLMYSTTWPPTKIFWQNSLTYHHLLPTTAKIFWQKTNHCQSHIIHTNEMILLVASLAVVVKFSPHPLEFDLSKKLTLVNALPKGTCPRKLCEIPKGTKLGLWK